MQKRILHLYLDLKKNKIKNEAAAGLACNLAISISKIIEGTNIHTSAIVAPPKKRNIYYTIIMTFLTKKKKRRNNNNTFVISSGGFIGEMGVYTQVYWNPQKRRFRFIFYRCSVIIINFLVEHF